MTEYDSSNVAFFAVDEFQLLGFSSRVSDPGAAQKTAERMPLGESLQRKVILKGIEPVTIEQGGWFSTDAGATHEALAAKRGTAQLLAYGVSGNVIGRDFVGAQAAQAVYDPRIVKGDLVQTAARWECDEYERGLIVAHLAARTAAGHTQATPVTNDAQTLTGAVAYLFCSALTLDGYTNVIVTVRDSDDNITYGDLASFTARTVPGAQRLVIAGTIEKYLAISWAYTGAGTSPTWTGLVGVART